MTQLPPRLRTLLLGCFMLWALGRLYALALTAGSDRYVIEALQGAPLVCEDDRGSWAAHQYLAAPVLLPPCP